MAKDLVVQRSNLPSRRDTFRAAQYVRMSTEMQRYSIQNQAAVIAAYAHAHGLQIVRTYADEGESGLRIKNRAALQRLIADVRNGEADFSHILVYDVSRWGRFQDTDESAHYEFICREAGVKVSYCAEQFDNDGSMLSSIVKNLKRVMAAEYSRELSVKIYAGACRSAELGFRQGGRPGYGLRRELIDENRRSKGLMENGQRKYLQSDRVLLQAGPPEEAEVVRSIFAQFVIEKKPQTKIARQLNARGIPTTDGKPWTEWTVHYILKNENYIGNLLYNRTSFRLRQRRQANPPDLWIRTEHAFEPIVEPALFFQAQRRLENHYLQLSNEEMLKRLRITLKQRGSLSRAIIDETLGLPSAPLYQLRFGSLRNAYKLIGYLPKRDFHDIDSRHEREAMVVDLASHIARRIEGRGGRARFDGDTNTLTVDGQVEVSIRIARRLHRSGERPIWTVFRQRHLAAGLILAARLNETNDAILDYLLLPSRLMSSQKLRISDRMMRTRGYEAFRFTSFEAMARSLLRRTRRSRSCRGQRRARTSTGRATD